MKEGRFVETKARSNVTSHTEVGVLRGGEGGEGENETQHTIIIHYAGFISGGGARGCFRPLLGLICSPLAIGFPYIYYGVPPLGFGFAPS